MEVQSHILCSIDNTTTNLGIKYFKISTSQTKHIHVSCESVAFVHTSVQKANKSDLENVPLNC